jgi:hypothetical protein
MWDRPSPSTGDSVTSNLTRRRTSETDRSRFEGSGSGGVFLGHRRPIVCFPYIRSIVGAATRLRRAIGAALVVSDLPRALQHDVAPAYGLALPLIMLSTPSARSALVAWELALVPVPVSLHEAGPSSVPEGGGRIGLRGRHATVVGCVV